MYKVNIFREANSAVTAQRFDIMVDEKIAGKILSNEHKSIVFDDNSQRKLHIQCGMFRSNSIFFTPQKDKTLSFTCGSELNQKESLIKIVGITLLIIIVLTALITSFEIASTPAQFIVTILILLGFYLIAIKEIVFYKPIIELKQNQSITNEKQEVKSKEHKATQSKNSNSDKTNTSNKKSKSTSKKE
ncbi:MAG: hypothetical protein ACLFPL_04505 [Candidatus Nanoarchaeia archaeon]